MHSYATSNDIDIGDIGLYKYPEALSIQALHPQEARLLALVPREGGADEDTSTGHQKSGCKKMK